GGLVSQPFPLQTMVAQIDANKNAGEFWSALGIPPRPAFYLTVTVALELAVLEQGPLVTTHFTAIEPGEGPEGETLVHVGGRVLGPQLVVVSAAATLQSANANQATVTSAADAANFRAGDVVVLVQGATSELTTIANISGSTITFQTNLANTFSGGTVRIADLRPGQSTIRLASVTGLQPGAHIYLTQLAHV